jgi:hypothetical protein
MGHFKKSSKYFGGLMKSGATILCPISEWEEHLNERGRGAGKVIQTRKVVAVDKYNFILARENKSEKDKIYPISYFSSMRSLLPSIPYEVPNWEDAINDVIGTLSKKTGKTAQIEINDPMNNLEELGRQIDLKLGTSFFNPWPPTVYYNIFKKEIEDDSRRT